MNSNTHEMMRRHAWEKSDSKIRFWFLQIYPSVGQSFDDNGRWLYNIFNMAEAEWRISLGHSTQLRELLAKIGAKLARHFMPMEADLRFNFFNNV
jgi:hypothetical protein